MLQIIPPYLLCFKSNSENKRSAFAPTSTTLCFSEVETETFRAQAFVLFQVKNKAPAEVQITAEQLLREAKERELELLPPPPKQKITDKEELNDYKLKKRKVSSLTRHTLML